MAYENEPDVKAAQRMKCTWRARAEDSARHFPEEYREQVAATIMNNIWIVFFEGYNTKANERENSESQT